MKNRKQLVPIVVVLLLLIAAYVLFFKKESYVVLVSKCLSRDAPTWCPDEFSVVYSSSATSDKDLSFYNEETGMCSDGTRDCVYVEKYDNNRILQGIFNSKNVELGQKFLDDVYAGNITFSPETITEIKEGIKFENGVMKFKNNPEEDTFSTIKVGMVSEDERRELIEQQGIVVVPPSLFLLYLAIYFRFNNLPKPTLKYELKSEISMREYRNTLPSASVADQPQEAATPEPQTTVG